MRKVNQHNSAKDMRNLPYSEDAIRDFIHERLKKYVGKTYYNKSLGVNIFVTSDGVRETMQNCRANRQAAQLALHLPYILRHAKVIRLHLPVISKKQKERFAFTEIAEMRCQVKKVGVAKIIVGYKVNNRVVEYSITNFQILNKTGLFDF